MSMTDFLLIALFAFLGAVAAGLLGAGVLWLIRRRSLTTSLAVVAAVAVTAMLAGTLSVARAMFLSTHDLTVVTMVVAMAAVVSLVTALVLGRWVVAGEQGTHRRCPFLRRRRPLRCSPRLGERRTRRAEPGVGQHQREARHIPGP